MAPNMQTASVLFTGRTEALDLETIRLRFADQRVIDTQVPLTFELKRVRSQGSPQLEPSMSIVKSDVVLDDTIIPINWRDWSLRNPEGPALDAATTYGSLVSWGWPHEVGYPAKRFENFPFLPTALVEMIQAAQHSNVAVPITSFSLERMEDGVRFIKKHDSLGADEDKAVKDLIRNLALKIRRAVPYKEQPFVTQAADGSLALDLTTKSGRLLAAFVSEDTWNSRFVPNQGVAKKLRVLTTEELATTLEQLLAGFA